MRKGKEHTGKVAKEMVGKPVSRAVLDEEERVVVNAGDVITHESIERARHAGVLKELYAAAWMGEPSPVGEERIRRQAEIRARRKEELKKEAGGKTSSARQRGSRP